MEPRKEVKEFAELMEEKLRENDYKGHWSGCSYAYLIQRLHEEVKELHEALSSFVIGQSMPRDLSGSYSIEQYGEVEDECRDVSNIAMMIADNCKHLRDNKEDYKYFIRMK